jgi:hypothetical protein
MLAGFVFQSTKSIVVEPGSSAQIGELIAGLGCKSVLLVSDPGVLISISILARPDHLLRIADRRIYPESFGFSGRTAGGWYSRWQREWVQRPLASKQLRIQLLMPGRV